MSCIEDCIAVIENLDGKNLAGELLQQTKTKKTLVQLYPETEHNLFVGNLSWSETSENMTQAFQEYGTVVGASVLYT